MRRLAAGCVISLLIGVVAVLELERRLVNAVADTINGVQK